MNWIQDRKKSLEWSIKFTTKAFGMQMGILFLNVAGLAWNIYWRNNSISSGFGMGMFAGNCIWTLVFAAKYYEEIKNDKRELAFITELEIKENLDEDREYYKKARKTYEDFFTKNNIMGDCESSESKIIVCTKGNGGDCH